MLTIFDQAESQMLADMQVPFGSDYTFLPMRTRPNQRPVQDPKREAFDIRGILYVDHQLSDMDKNSRIDRAGHKRSMSFNNVSAKVIRLNLRICDLKWNPVQFDAVVSKQTGQVYEIMDIWPSGHSDLDLKLNEVEGVSGVTG